MEITARVDVEYRVAERASVHDVLRMFQSPRWLQFVMRSVTPRLRAVSPADKSVLDDLDTQSTTRSDHELMPVQDCAICLDSSSAKSSRKRHVRLECSHSFHANCIHPWLRVQSTCPICRFQFPRAFKGHYTVRSLHSTLQLPRTSISISRRASLGAGQILRARVRVELLRVATHDARTEYPCEMSTWVRAEGGHSRVREFREEVAPRPASAHTTGGARLEQISTIAQTD